MNVKQFYKYILTLVAILMTTTPAWAATATLGAKKQNVTADGITFSLGGSYTINNILVDYSYTGSGKEASLSWTVPTGYTISVSQITINAKNDKALFGSTGKGQYKTSKNSSYIDFCNKNSWQTYTLNSSSYFPLGNNSSITMKAIERELQWKDIVFTYTKTAHKYNIAFNANGGTGTTQGISNVSYDTDVKLTPNGFTRNKFTITYDANGGTCATAQEIRNYTFAGWAETSTGNVKYSDQQVVRNLSATNGATVTLYAKWNEPNATITLPIATKEGAVLEGWYLGETKIGEAGDTYTPTSSVTLTAKWIEKYTPEITGSNATMLVGNTLPNAFTFKNTFNPTAVITTKSISDIRNGNEVITYDAIENEIIAHNAGIAEIYFYQAPTTTIEEGYSATYTITVNKRTTDFEINFANEYFVDDEINKSTFFTNSTNGEVAIQVSDKTADNRALFTYNGSILKANGATLNANSETTTITVTQPETYKWTGKTLTKEVLVKKYPTDFSWLLKDTYYVEDVITDIFTKTNNSLSSTITSSNPNIVKVEGNQLVALNAGKAAITISQATDRKWVAFTQTKEITVLKHDIVATINPNIAYWNELVSNPFSATSTHPVSGQVTPIDQFNVEQQDNEHIALMNATTRDIQTYYTNGQVNFQITRPEDYKYNALNQTLTLTVNANNNGCNLLYDPTHYKIGAYENNNGVDFTLSGIGDILTFQLWKNNLATQNVNVYGYNANGTQILNKTYENSSITTDENNANNCSVQLSEDIVKIKIQAGGTLNKHFKNLTVTRAQYLRPTEGGHALNSTNALVLPTVAVGQPSSKQFHLEWSACTDIKIVWSNPKFTINTTDITTRDGSIDITVSCNTSEVGTFTDNVVIYNQEQMETFPITCEVYTKWLTDSIRGSATHSMKVDKTWETDFYFPIQRASQYPTIDGAFHYAIKHTFVDENQADRNPNYPNEVISYNNGVITAHNAGTAILTIKHDETAEHFESQQFTCTLTVSKHDVERTWKDPVYFNDTIDNYFTTSNTVSPIEIESQTDTDVAKLTNEFNPTSNNSLDLITFNKEASTTVTVSQAETYHWKGYSEQHTITPIDPNNHVTFTLTQENYIPAFKHSFVDPAANDQSKGPDWQSGGIYFGGEGVFEGAEGWNWDEKYFIIQFTGIPDSIYFDASRSGSATGTIKLSVSEGKTPDNLTEVWSNSNNSENNKIIRKLNPDSRYLKFSYTGNLWGLFKNITVTELNEFRAVEVNNHEVDVEFLNFDSIQVNTSKTMSFAFKYANAGYKVELISTDPHFTINPSSITDIGGENHGTRQIDVTYTSSVPHATNEDAMIIISDEHGHKDTVQLIASAYKLKQTLRWRADFEAVEKPLIPLNGGDISDAAYSTSGLTIKYLSDNSNVIAISSDGTTLIPMGEGEATITATQTGNELWNPAESITKTFIVTDKRLQYIIWNDPLSDLVKSDNNQTITLTAQVYVQTEDGQIVYSPEQTAKLTYQSADTSIVSVSGSLLTIHSVGKTTLTAHVPATDDFAAATLTVPVIVRPETAGCEDVLLFDENGPIQFFQYSLDEIIKEAMPLDLNKGIPGYVLVEHYGESWDLAIQYYAAEIRVEESTDGGNSWNTITTIYPAEDKVNIDSIPLSRTATHIRFARNSGGQGYQFLQNIKVHPAQFIEGPDVIDFGQIHVGSREEQTFTISYSNIKSTLSPVVSSTDVVATPSSFGECGEFGTQTIQVFWTPSQLGENMQETVTFTDFNSEKEKVVILRAQNIQKGLQQLNWDAPEIIEHCGHIHFPEKTTADLPITWEVIEGKQYADFVDGTLTLFQNGTIQIKGSNNGSNNYEPFEKIYTFQIAINPIFMGTEDEDWNNTNNWNICRLPYEHEAVTIQASTVLTEAISIAGITFAMGENGNLGSIHITSTGGLSVGAQGITGAATDGSSITIDNLQTGAGFLRISPEYTGTMPKTTVRYQTKSTLDTGANQDATWQYIGAPGANCQFTVDYITWLYQWSEPQNWINKTGILTLEPFAGYAITQYGKPTYELIAEPINQNQTIQLTKTESGMNGNNLFANSFMAPIDAKNFTPEDFTGDLEKTFYIFNSGSWNNWNKYNTEDSKGSNGNDTPGQYCAVPAFSSSYMDVAEITTLPPMQGIYVIANADGAKIRLNYDKHVWKAGTNTNITTDMHEPMRTPQRIQAQEQMQRSSFRRIRLQLNSANSGADRLYIIQSDETTPNYDNGYDAPNQTVNGLTNIYTTESFGKMEVSCSNHIDSMYIGFQAGSDTQYTLSFSSLIGDMLYLEDLEQDTVVAMQQDMPYTFTATALSINDHRFRLLLSPKGGNNSPTDTEDINNVSIWMDNNVLHITGTPANSTLQIYNVSGAHILTQAISDTPYTYNLSHLSAGVYLIRINNYTYKVIKK